jgi:hypothetical protein
MNEFFYKRTVRKNPVDPKNAAGTGIAIAHLHPMEVLGLY